MSLFDELVSPKLAQSCELKTVSKFLDFPDRIDINQNQKKKAEVERLQLLIKQGLGKHLYSENPNNITTNEEELAAREQELANFATTLWVYLDLSFLAESENNTQNIEAYPKLIKEFHRKSKCKLVLLVDKEKLPKLDCGENYNKSEKSHIQDLIKALKQDTLQEYLKNKKEKELEEQDNNNCTRHCCIRHFLPEGYINYVQSYDDAESLKLYAISSARYTRGVIISNDLVLSVFSRIKFAPLELQSPEIMKNGQINILNMETLTKSLTLKNQSDLILLYASSELLIDNRGYVKRKFTAADFLEKISTKDNRNLTKIDQTLLEKELSKFLWAHKSQMEKKNKQTKQTKEYVKLLGKILKELVRLEQGKIVNNFFDEKMMSSCSNLAFFQD